VRRNLLDVSARLDFQDLRTHNRRWTWVLLAASFLLLGVVASIASAAVGGGWVGLVVGVGLAAVLTWISYAKSESIALSATNAHPAPVEQFGQLHNVVESIAVAAGIPKPKVYVVNDPAPNAFATGKDPDHAAVAVTTGLLQKMNRDELEGVVAHELAHVRNYDIRVMTVAVATAGAIAVITDVFWRMMYFGAIFGGGRRDNDRDGNGANPVALIAMVFVAILAPLAAALMKAAISRRRESLADATAVSFTRYPTGLRRALEKLDADSSVVQKTSHATSHLWIESPDDRTQGNRGAKFNEMFNTHPPLRERIDLLRRMEGLDPYTGPGEEIVRDLAQRTQHTPPPTLPAPAVRSGVAAANPAAASMPNLPQLFDQAGGSSRLPQPAKSERPHAPAGHHDPQPAPPAGWYADPSGRPRMQRYWNGTQWTDHTARR
jgi:heat shock protein HtpX